MCATRCGSLREVSAMRPLLGLLLTLFPQAALAQQNAPPGCPPGTPASPLLARNPCPPDPQGAPLTLTLHDALERARLYSPQFQKAATALDIAHENTIQARATLLPSVDYLTQELLTEGNGRTPIGRYVTNDGVHVYRAWGVVHQTLSADTLTRAGYRRTTAAQEVARAQQEIALRGLNVTVTQAYYALVVAEREYATAQQSLNQAAQSLKISQQLEQGHEVAHSDVITFQIAYNQQQQAFQEAKLALDNAHLDLAVLLFPNFYQNFNVIDDLDTPPPLPSLPELTRMAQSNNPEIGSALASVRETQFGVSEAKAALLPSITVDANYGIEANYFALHSIDVEFPEAGRLPNLGFFITFSLNVPVWHWGANVSKVRQAEYERRQARVELTSAQREVLKDLYSGYNTARAAFDELDGLRNSANLAADGFRLNTLRYQSGDATVLDLVNAEATVKQTRDSYASGLARYRVALAVLQTVTGTF